MKKILLLTLLFAVLTAQAQKMNAYQIYDHKGKKTDFGKMVKKLADYDVVLFGEYHNNAIIHWLEFKTAKGLHDRVGGRLIFGAEMYERDNQEAINRYLSGEIEYKKLEEEARLWPNDKTDYKPILDFAKEKGVPMIATNVPRRYASIVAKQGQDSLILKPEEVAWVVKLPYEVTLDTPGYKEIRDMMGPHAGGKAMDFVAAQAIKDATMAESILKHWSPGKLFYHYEGDFHSKEYGGIYWYLKQSNPDLKIAVISMSESSEIHLPLAKDFIKTEFNIVIPEDMAKTY